MKKLKQSPQNHSTPAIGTRTMSGKINLDAELDIFLSNAKASGAMMVAISYVENVAHPETGRNTLKTYVQKSPGFPMEDVNEAVRQIQQNLANMNRKGEFQQ